ncbi:hypothetical protein CL657_05025 [bacterium]|nr:hypothetical protein [bacterium]|tara:strand:+ start:509 stop:1291 length:783 start_codon:yes stop_codon:yes gene_type:complete
MFQKSYISVGSHRGLTSSKQANIYPNTIAAFETIHQNKADYWECDCIMTKDQEIVLFHDATFNNTPIIDLSSNILTQSDYQIETLDSFLNQFVNHPKQFSTTITLCLELKFYHSNDTLKKTFSNNVIKILKKFKLDKNVIIISFDPDLLNHIYEASNTYPLGLNLKLIPKRKPYNTLSKKALNHSIISKLTYCCPHIDSLDHKSLPNLPKLIWESKGETQILNHLEHIIKKESLSKFFNKYNIKGFTTNTVEAVYNLIYK